MPSRSSQADKGRPRNHAVRTSFCRVRREERQGICLWVLYVKGASSQQEERGERTYEFVLKISNYALLSITWKPIWVPRTKAVLEQLKRKKKKRNGEPMKLNAKYPLLVCLPCSQQG